MVMTDSVAEGQQARVHVGGARGEQDEGSAGGVCIEHQGHAGS